jgi:hypothetical protein
MAAPGSNFNTTVEIAASPDTVAQTLIAAASGDPKYSVTSAGSGSIILTRRYTPAWAIVVAIIGLLIFLIGLLALLVKTTETLTLTVAPVEGGSRVTTSGVATAEMAARITAALNGMPALGAPGAALPPVSGEMKTCPACAEEVKAAAKVCRFCGFEFSAAPAETG